MVRPIELSHRLAQYNMHRYELRIVFFMVLLIAMHRHKDLQMGSKSWHRGSVSGRYRRKSQQSEVVLGREDELRLWRESIDSAYRYVSQGNDDLSPA